MYPMTTNPAFALNVISKIRQNAEEFLRDSLDKAGACGLVSSHGHILAALYTEKKLSMYQIAQKIGRCKSTLTVLAQKLEQEGFIARAPDEEDSRVRYISLTQKGESFGPIFQQISDDMNNTLWDGFSEEEKNVAMDTLFRLEKNSRKLLPPTKQESA